MTECWGVPVGQDGWLVVLTGVSRSGLMKLIQGIRCLSKIVGAVSGCEEIFALGQR